jgi:nicotinamide-nucleotide amidase
MRIEIVAVGTELLLGQIADTNSAWLGDRLAANGVTSHFHQAVGDNHERITLARPHPGRHHARSHRGCHERRA